MRRRITTNFSREFFTAVSVGLLLALLASLIMILGGMISGSIEAVNAIAASLSVIVTCLMVGGILELRVAFGQLKFDTLNKIYESLSAENSEELEQFKDFRNESSKCGNHCQDYAIKLAGRISREFNRVGHYVYRDYMDSETMMEEFGGLIIRSWGLMKPYLKVLRDRDEVGQKSKKWFMRRYYLMLVAAVEAEMIKEGGLFTNYLNNVKTENFLDPSKPAVPEEWLSDDIVEWLKGKKLYKYVYVK